MIRLLVSDVDGTLVQPDKSLAPGTVAAAHRLRDAGVALALISARPPRGMRWLSDALGLTTPLSGFNGGAVVTPDGAVLDSLPVPESVVRQALELFAARGVSAWLFTPGEWLVLDPAGDYVDHERHTVRFNERVVESFAPYTAQAGKLVGVSRDHAHLAAVELELQGLVGRAATVHRSQHYYLDVTHPDANKGAAVRRLAARLGVELADVAVIGDMVNDVPMFRVAGLAIAMGNAEANVQAEAQAVTEANDRDGWAQAVDRFVLGRAELQHA